MPTAANIARLVSVPSNEAVQGMALSPPAFTEQGAIEPFSGSTEPSECLAAQQSGRSEIMNSRYQHKYDYLIYPYMNRYRCANAIGSGRTATEIAGAAHPAGRSESRKHGEGGG